jgi:hypothetical protein
MENTQINSDTDMSSRSLEFGRQCTVSFKTIPTDTHYYKHKSNEQINIRYYKEMLLKKYGGLSINCPSIDADDNEWNVFIKQINLTLLPNNQLKLIKREFGRDSDDDELIPDNTWGQKILKYWRLYCNDKLPVYQHSIPNIMYKYYILDNYFVNNLAPNINAPWYVWNEYILYLNTKMSNGDEKFSCFLNHYGQFENDDIITDNIIVTFDKILYYIDKYIIYNRYLHMFILYYFLGLYYIWHYAFY